jgi:hypothetical protein
VGERDQPGGEAGQVGEQVGASVSGQDRTIQYVGNGASSQPAGPVSQHAATGS